MPIPRTRTELTDYVRSTYEKLESELDGAGSRIGNVHCIDDWSVKDLVAVRAWWTENVIDWVEAGQRGEHPITPAQGYLWKEAPKLNVSESAPCILEQPQHELVLLDEVLFSSGIAIAMANSVDQ